MALACVLITVILLSLPKSKTFQVENESKFETVYYAGVLVLSILTIGFPLFDSSEYKSREVMNTEFIPTSWVFIQ